VPDGESDIAESKTAKKASRKMSREDVTQALGKCQTLLTQALQRAKGGNRPQLSDSLVDLSNQVIVAIETANKEFQKEMVPYLARLVQAHIEALFRTDERPEGEGQAARKQLEVISEELSRRLTSPQAVEYNPLELKQLAESTKTEFDRQPMLKLDGIKPFQGAGVYALYYEGDFAEYKPISTANRKKRGSLAIYVGEAGRQGKRKGIDLEGTSGTSAIYERLSDHHTKSIKAAANLSIGDFWIRYLPIQSLFVPLCEALLIERHHPLWNQLVDGFGNKHMGVARIDQLTGQQITPWDLLHPGRENRATKPNKRFPNVEILKVQIRKFLSGNQKGVPVLSMSEAIAAASE
jgi:Eco29kI restriction endonuclease